jgi:hypothetical protein
MCATKFIMKKFYVLPIECIYVFMWFSEEKKITFLSNIQWTLYNRDRGCLYCKVKQSLHRTGQPLGIPGGYVSRFQDNQHMKVVRVSAMNNGRFYRSENILGTHFWFLLQSESTRGPECGRKIYINKKFQWRRREYWHSKVCWWHHSLPKNRTFQDRYFHKAYIPAFWQSHLFLLNPSQKKLKNLIQNVIV